MNINHSSCFYHLKIRNYYYFYYSQLGVILVTVYANDSDGRDNMISYSLSGADAENFTINNDGTVTHTVAFPAVDITNVSDNYKYIFDDFLTAFSNYFIPRVSITVSLP